MNIGVQTFTVRRAQKKNIKKAYLPLIELGIKRFEVARIDFTSKNAEIIAELIREHGIEIVSIQVKPKYVFGAVDKIVDFCKVTGCKNVVISMLPFGCILGSEEKFFRFVDSLDSMAEVYAEHGIRLAYHHHNWEYIRLSSGKTRMIELLERTKRIGFVHDTYWTARCGIDPAIQIAEFGERLVGIHLRDLSHSAKGISVKSQDVPIGDGVINFARVLSAAEKVGCSYMVIEQNTKSPYRDIERSLKAVSNIKSTTKE